MGVIRIFLKGIPQERHLDSLEINQDLSDLTKQRAYNHMRQITIEEYFKIMEENKQRTDSYQPGKGFPPEVHIYSGMKWRGLFETARKAALEFTAEAANEALHIRGRYDCIESKEAEKFEETVLRSLQRGELEGQVMSFGGKMFPRERADAKYGLITVGMWPTMTFEMQALQERLMERLKRIDGMPYDSEISSTYAKPSLFTEFQVVVETKADGIHIRVDRRKQQKRIVIRSAELREPYSDDQPQFNDLLEPKPSNDPTYFSRTILAGKSRRYY
jgi:hypothetical protein